MDTPSDFVVLQALARQRLFYFVWIAFNRLHSGVDQTFVANWHVKGLPQHWSESRRVIAGA
jgi:hypothetical protein